MKRIQLNAASNNQRILSLAPSLSDKFKHPNYSTYQAKQTIDLTLKEKRMEFLAGLQQVEASNLSGEVNIIETERKCD